jgi:hypothetical protein
MSERLGPDDLVGAGLLSVNEAAAFLSASVATGYTMMGGGNCPS